MLANFLIVAAEPSSAGNSDGCVVDIALNPTLVS